MLSCAEGGVRGEITSGLLGEEAATAEARDQLPVSPCISLDLPRSPCISLDLPSHARPAPSRGEAAAYISLDLPASPHISVDLPISIRRATSS